MPDEPFIDTHIHFWDHAVEGLRWSWLTSGYTFRRWRGSAELDAPRYTTPELLAEAHGTGLAAAVHVHAADVDQDPAVETAWLESVGEETGMPQGIVGACTLGDRDAEAVLRRQHRFARFRGVRDHGSPQRLVVEEIAPAMDVATELALSVEVRRAHDEFAVLEEIADRWPATPLVLSHACLPLDRSPADLAAWSAAMGRLARHANVVCKIATVAGASDPDWTPAGIRPWILSCVANFGAERCMLGSNFPVDRLFATYPALIDAYRQVTAELDPDERAALFHRTAERVYRLPPVG